MQEPWDYALPPQNRGGGGVACMSSGGSCTCSSVPRSNVDNVTSSCSLWWVHSSRGVWRLRGVMLTWVPVSCAGLRCAGLKPGWE